MSARGWLHRYVDFFVEPMKRWFPQPVTFYRPDNKEGWFAKREKPLGYWLGHVVGYLVIICLVILVEWGLTGTIL